jgi:hypothetical protein
MKASLLFLCGCAILSLGMCYRPSPPPLPTTLAPHDLLLSRDDDNLLTVSVITRDGVTGASLAIDCEKQKAVARGQNADGKRTGTWERQNWKGMIVARESFLGGRRDGLCEYWDDEGNMIVERSGLYRFDVLQK